VPRPRLPSNRRFCRQLPAGTNEPSRTRTFRGTGPGRAGHTPPRLEESRGGTPPAMPHGHGKPLRLAKLPNATGCRRALRKTSSWMRPAGTSMSTGWVEPSHAVRADHEMRLGYVGRERVVVVQRVITKRRSAPVAVECLHREQPSPAVRAGGPGGCSRPRHRPSDQARAPEYRQAARTAEIADFLIVGGDHVKTGASSRYLCLHACPERSACAISVLYTSAPPLASASTQASGIAGIQPLCVFGDLDMPQ